MAKSITDWFFSVETQIEKWISKLATPLYRTQQQAHLQENNQWMEQFTKQNTSLFNELDPTLTKNIENEIQSIDRQLKLLEDSKLIEKQGEIPEHHVEKQHQ